MLGVGDGCVIVTVTVGVIVAVGVGVMVTVGVGVIDTVIVCDGVHDGATTFGT